MMGAKIEVQEIILDQVPYIYYLMQFQKHNKVII